MSFIELPGIEPYQVAELVPARPIIIGYRGSHAHGLYVPPEDELGIDDVDLMTVFIPALDFYFGTESHRDTYERFVGRYDSVAYELRKFAGLLAKGNPNVLSLLWLKPEHLLYVSREGRMLIESRHLFLSRVVYHSFSGYAHAQMKRMTAFHDEGGDCGCAGEFHQAECKVAQERGRGSQKKFATGFMGAKRKALVERFGYDCKNAAHLIRLLAMGAETLRDGTVHVDRTGIDADRLKAIKRGDWPLAKVKALADEMFDGMTKARMETRLPERVDSLAINDLVVDILSEAKAADVVLRARAGTERRGKL